VVDQSRQLRRGQIRRHERSPGRHGSYACGRAARRNGRF
jgi:hypothetical protein